MEKFVIKNANTSFTKKDAIAIVSIGFEKGIINNPENVVAVFKGRGIWPVSFPHMQSR